MKNKNEVCVLVNTPELLKQVGEILTKAGEKLYYPVEKAIETGVLNETWGTTYNYLHNPDGTDWRGAIVDVLKVVSIEELAEILGVADETIVFEQKFKSFNEAMQCLSDGINTKFLGFPDDASPDQWLPKLNIEVENKLVDGTWPATVTFTYTKIK